MQNLWILCLLLLLSNASSSFCLDDGDCNYQGDCRGFECYCDQGYFTDNSDDPCDTEATLLQKGQTFMGTMDDEDDWAYFYIPLSGIDGSLEFVFTITKYEATAYYSIQDSDEDHLPDEYNNFLCVAQSAIYKSCEIPSTNLKNTNNQWLVIGLRNEYSDRNSVTIKYTVSTENNDDSTSSTPVRNIIIGCAVAAGVIFIVALCIWRRVKRRRMRFRANQRAHRGRRASHDVEAPAQAANQNEHQVDPDRNYAPVLSQNHLAILANPPRNQNNAAPAQPQNHHHPRAQAQAQAQNHNNHNHHGQRPNQGQVQPQVQPVAQNQARRQGPQSNLLTMEEIQKYFPKQDFSKLQQPFPQTACSICLDEFRPETICHQLYCFHIFHEKCIEAWLAKHDSCPDCRMPITRKAIKEFLKAEKKRKEQEQKANKVKIMSSSIRGSKAAHKAQAQTVQRRGSNHDIHVPSQQDMHAPPQQDLHAPPQQDMYAPPERDIHAPPLEP